MITDHVDKTYLGRVLITAAVVFLGVVVLLLFWTASRVFLLGFAGALLGVFLRSLAQSTSHRSHLAYGWSLALVLVLLLVLTGLGWWLVSAQLSEQIASFQQRLPDTTKELREQLQRYSWGRWILSYTQAVQENAQQNGLVRQLTNMAASALDAVAGFVVVFFVGIYLAAEPRFYFCGVVRLAPLNYRSRFAEVLRALEYNLRWWIYTRLISMGVIGVLTALGLWALGMEMVLTLALLAAVLQIIPNFGPLISAVPAMLAAFPQGTNMMLYVALLYLGIQLLETYLITPVVERNVVRMPPALAIMAQVLLGLLGGVVGLLVAAPLALTVLVLTKMFYVEDGLGDREVDVPGERRHGVV